MNITAISFIEEGDAVFRISFMYGDHNLVTGSLPRTSTKEEVKALIKERVREWKALRADSNFQELKDEFENKELPE